MGVGEREKAGAILKELERSNEYVSPGELSVLYGALDARKGICIARKSIRRTRFAVTAS